MECPGLGTDTYADGCRASAWEVRMRISDVLRGKGAEVVTVTPETTVRSLLAVLAEHWIGAVVVSRDGTSVDGIVSERDIVRALAGRRSPIGWSRGRSHPAALRFTV